MRINTKIIFIFISLFSIASNVCIAQQKGLPHGKCGIEFIYDAAGNMIDRNYICNNTNVNYTTKRKDSINTKNGPATKLEPIQDADNNIQGVDVLYPNPTTGKFNIRLMKPVKNATVSIADARGGLVYKSTATGSLLQFDVSDKAAGIYFITIAQGATTIKLKLIKQ